FPTNNELTVLYLLNGGSEGNAIYSKLVEDNEGSLLGTTLLGGPSNAGTIFKLTTNGTLNVLNSFMGEADGRLSTAGLVLGDGGAYYGTASQGGISNKGTIFRITSNGDFTNLYAFQGGLDGGAPQAALVRGGDGNFYGTTERGPGNGAGTIFKI